MDAPLPPRDPLFEVDQLSLVYAGFHGQPPASILKNVSVRVERGGALVLLGPSGSGKSTLLRCLNRLAEPTGGSVRFDGRDIRSLDPRDLRPEGRSKQTESPVGSDSRGDGASIQGARISACRSTSPTTG